MAVEKLISMRNRGPVISEEDVLHFEQKLGRRLPDDYRDFLLTFNGGQPSLDQAVFSFGEDSTILNSFDGLHDPAGDIEETRERLSSQLPLELLVIGYDCGGSSVCLAIDGDKRGEVWFYDTLDPPTESKLWLPWYDRKREFKRVASSFTEFINMLRPTPSREQRHE